MGASTRCPHLFTMASPLLEAIDLKKSFGGLTAVDGFTITLNGGELYGLIGPNGAGKTTVFNLLTGHIRPDSGHIRIAGKDLTGKPPWYFACERIIRTFQNIRLLWDCTVEENLIAASYMVFKYSFWSGLLGLRKFTLQHRHLLDTVDQVCEKCGLTQYRKMRAADLPYGVQRRVEIARGLLLQPKVFLLDEPTAGLTPTEVAEILELLQSAWREKQFSMIVIEHNMRVIMNLAQYIIVMSEGKIIAHGSPTEVQTNPEVIRVYLGERYVSKLQQKR